MDDALVRMELLLRLSELRLQCLEMDPTVVVSAKLDGFDAYEYIDFGTSIEVAIKKIEVELTLKGLHHISQSHWESDVYIYTLHKEGMQGLEELKESKKMYIERTKSKLSEEVLLGDNNEDDNTSK